MPHRHRLLRAAAVLCILFITGAAAADETRPPATSAEVRQGVVRPGERMYREGILPSGRPMQAVVKGDIEVAGTAFTCTSCHLRSGLGSLEGQVFTPPTNGRSLYQPAPTLHKRVIVASAPPRRPAYTDTSLAEAIRGGVDPSGRALGDVMPRYMLEDEDMAHLAAYLKSLSSDFSPGVTDTEIHLATIVSEDVPAESREAMLAVLEDFVTFRNRSSKAFRLDLKRSRMADTMLGSRDAVYRDLKLSIWVLKGPPHTWREQLEAHYRLRPVFAFIGGIVTGEWRPIHDFSEELHIPALFPMADFPVISDTDWYTLYLSKGYYQEGEGAARYLNARDDLADGGGIVQIVRDSPEGRALSAGFRAAWEEIGRPAPLTITLKAGEELTAESLGRIGARGKPSAVMLWDGPASLPALGALSAGAGRPGLLLVSSGYLGEALWTIKSDLRDLVYITYPFRLPQEEAAQRFFEPFLKKAEDRKVQQIMKQTYSAIYVLAKAIMEMKGNYFRDYFLDVIGMMEDQQVPLYERLSFGPGQRYASKGCYIVQLDKTARPQLLKRSAWVIH